MTTGNEGPRLDHTAWTDKAGAARAAQCREETIDLWLRQGRFTAEEAYQKHTERRGVGRPWIISMAALERVVRDKGRAWHPELAAPIAPLPDYIVALIAMQQEQIDSLTARLAARGLTRAPTASPPITMDSHQSPPSITMDSREFPVADAHPPEPAPPRPRLRRPPEPPTEPRPIRADVVLEARYVLLPEHWIAVSTWCKMHNLDERSIRRKIHLGQMPQPHRAPKDEPWRTRHGHQPVTTAYDPDQQREAASFAREFWQSGVYYYVPCTNLWCCGTIGRMVPFGEKRDREVAATPSSPTTEAP